ncbi:hypothetical protein ACAG26_16045 [Mycobacterium sp. pUA109]|uniref:hypothetical protein n=1 Tax=Mycobacterium sp. pUA109 TaxID=3238982 RepID=UPI00351B4A59
MDENGSSLQQRSAEDLGTMDPMFGFVSGAYRAIMARSTVRLRVLDGALFNGATALSTAGEKPIWYWLIRVQRHCWR